MSFDPIQYDTMSDEVWFGVYDHHLWQMQRMRACAVEYAWLPAYLVMHLLDMHAHHLKQMEHRALLAELRRATIECLTKSNGAPAATPSRT